MSEEGDAVRLRRTFRTHPMNASSMADVEMQTFTLVVTVSPYLDATTQKARLREALQRERAAWKTVAKLQCDGMEFSDHFLDGFCFRAKTDAQQRRVTAWRAARDRWLAVPRFFRGTDFSIALRGGGLELTDGPCNECVALEQKVAAALSAYPADGP